MSDLKFFECPSCGSPLSTDGETPTVVCEYCGRTIVVPEALRVQHAPAPAPSARPAPLRAEDPAPRRRSNRGCGCVVIPLVLIVLAAAALMVFAPGQSVQKLQAAAGLPTAKPTIVPVNRPLAPPATQKVSYANLQFSVIGGALTNQIPDDATNHESQLRRDQAHAYLNLKIQNPTGNGILADQNLLALQLGDGGRYAEESGWADWINAQSTQEKRLYFTVPVTATWQGARLLIGLPNKEPAVLPLDGPAEPARYPVELKDRGKATVQNVDYEIQSVNLDLDAIGQRAATGRRFLRFILRTFNHGQYDAAVVPSNFRLAANGDMLAPVKAPSEAVAASSVYQAEVIFDIPADAEKVELQVGPVGQPDTRRLPVTIPAP